MKFNEKHFNVQDLLSLRKWFSIWEGSLKLDIKFVNQAREAVQLIDKRLWSTLVSNETPWGIEKEFCVEDPNFNNTLEEYFPKEKDE